MKIYNNSKTKLTIVSGQVESIAADRLSMEVKSEMYDRGKNERETHILPVSLDTQLADDISVGQDITTVAFYNARSKQYEAMYTSTKSGCYEEDSLCVVNGEVMFARMNEEKDENGQPRMTKERTTADGSVEAPRAKKPHFDIGIQTTEPDPNSDKEGETRRVLHIVKVYAKKARDKDGNEIPGKTDNKQVEQMARMFKNFDHKENPAIVTVVTSPGQEYSYEKEVNGKVYTNHQVSHMGYNSLDLTYIKGREQAKAAPQAAAQEQQAAPATEAAAPAKEDDSIPFAQDAAPQPAQTGSGFSAAVPEEEDELDTAGMFLDN